MKKRGKSSFDQKSFDKDVVLKMFFDIFPLHFPQDKKKCILHEKNKISFTLKKNNKANLEGISEKNIF